MSVTGGGRQPTASALLFGGLATVAASAVALQAIRARRRSPGKASAVPRERSTKVVVLGLGYCGGAIARKLATEATCYVVGTTRGEADPANGRAGVRTLVLGGGSTPEAAREGRASRATDELVVALREAEVVVATAPPGEGGDPFLAEEAIRGALEQAAQRGALLIYLSSVGVYGDQGGNLVTEETAAAPRTARAKRRLAAEEAWRALPVVRLAVVRLPGIYGAFRGPITKAGEGNALIVKEGHLFSRIHVEDVARTCMELLRLRQSESDAWLWAEGPVSVINCCDSEPAPQHEVSALAYTLLGRPVPPPIPFEKAELSAMQRSFYEESRRMGNHKLLNIVKDLKYPTFRDGLPACLEQERDAARSACGGVVAGAASRLHGAAGAVFRTLATRVASAFSAAPTTPRVALVDNGSLKPEATLSLRRLAAALEAAALKQGRALRVEAVSARFADRIPARDLDGRPAEILPGWLRRVSTEARPNQKVILAPLLIGPSATLTKSMPDAARALPQLDVEIAPSLVCLCPALFAPSATGASEVAGMLSERLKALGGDLADPGHYVMLCDHGSPVARVAAAREAVRAELQTVLGRDVVGCCMERREGPEFDFNGPLLQDALIGLPQGATCSVALLFLQEGRHAGPGGDIATIIASVMEQRADLSVATTQVLAGHPALIDLLLARLDKAIPLRLLG